MCVGVGVCVWVAFGVLIGSGSVREKKRDVKTADNKGWIFLNKQVRISADGPWGLSIFSHLTTASVGCIPISLHLKEQSALCASSLSFFFFAVSFCFLTLFWALPLKQLNRGPLATICARNRETCFPQRRASRFRQWKRPPALMVILWCRTITVIKVTALSSETNSNFVFYLFPFCPGMLLLATSEVFRGFLPDGPGSASRGVESY